MHELERDQDDAVHLLQEELNGLGQAAGGRLSDDHVIEAQRFVELDGEKDTEDG